MRVPRFYVGDELKLNHNFWVHDSELLREWHRHGLHQNDELVLFDGVRSDRLYRITQLNHTEAHVTYITDYDRQLPVRDVYVLWWAQGIDRDETFIRQGVTVGVTHFLPIIGENSAQGAADSERYRMVIIRATEQTERSDMPVIRNAMTLETALQELRGKVRLFSVDGKAVRQPLSDDAAIGLLIGINTDTAERLEGELYQQYQDLCKG